MFEQPKIFLSTNSKADEFILQTKILNITNYIHKELLDSNINGVIITIIK